MNTVRGPTTIVVNDAKAELKIAQHTKIKDVN